MRIVGSGKQPVPFRESMPPRPEDIYGIAKATMENVTKVMSEVYGFKYVIIRPHNVYGPRQNLSDPYRNVLGIFINRLMQGKPYFIYGDGEQTRDFIYVADVVKANILASRGCTGIFNVACGRSISLNILVAIIGKILGRDVRPRYEVSRPADIRHSLADIKKA